MAKALDTSGLQDNVLLKIFITHYLLVKYDFDNLK